MATRQYIGARYVPLFFNGAGGSAEWVANTQYEALTIVTRNGNSYTSRKSVPANIGAPEDNPSYWVSTGIFNEQVEMYRQEVQNIADDVTALDTKIDEAISNIDSKKILFIGESIGLNVNGSNKNMFQIAGDSLGLVEGSTYYHYSVGARGFCTTSETAPATFKDMLTTFFSTHDATEFTDVIVLGGPNDRLNSIADIEQAIAAFVNTAKTLNPHIKVSIGISAKNNVSQAGIASFHNYVKAYKRCILYGAKYLKGTEYVLYNTELQTDKLHPNADGVNALGYAIAECILTGSCHTLSTISYTNDKVTLDSAVQSITNISNFNQTISDNVVELTPFSASTSVVTLTSAFTGGAITLFTENEFICNCTNGAFMMCNIGLTYTNSGGQTVTLYDAVLLKNSNTWYIFTSVGFSNATSINIKRPTNATVIADYC